MRRLGPLRWIAAIVVLAALLAGGCTSDPPRDPVSRGSSASGSDTIELEERSLDSMLVDAADLPAGWKPATPDDDDSDSPVMCLRGIFLADAPERASAAFGRRDDVLAQVLARYESDDDAHAAYDASTDAIASCPDDSATQNGRTLNLTIEELDIESLGDESRAFSIALSDSTSSFGAYYLFALHGSTILITLAGTGSGMPSTADFAAFSRLADSMTA